MHVLSRRQAYAGAAALIVILALVWFVFLRQSGSQLQMITLQPTLFAEEISVSGTVTAAQDVDLGFTQSGRISHVYASVGDQVSAGTVIAEIDNGDLSAALAQKQAALDTQEANLASLKAGTRPEQLAVTEAQVSSDQASVAQAHIAAINAIQNAYTQSDDAIHNKVDQFFNNPRTSNPTLSFSTSNSQLASSLVSERLAAEGMLAGWQQEVSELSPSSDLSAAEKDAQANLANVTQLLSDANAGLNAAIYTTNVPQSTVSGYITNVATARANVNTAQISLTSAVTSETAASSTLTKDERSLTLEQAGSTSEDIAAQQAQVAAAKADVEAAQAQLAKTLVTAPFSGTISKMDAKPGEIVSPNTSEIAMISNGLFQIDTYVPEVEITGLAVGNSASTTLDAYGPDVVFPAKVISIDPAETVVNGVSTYKTTLQFLSADPRIKSGMTANVRITTVATPNALVVPIGAVFQKDGRSVVQVQKNGSVVDIPVQTGGTSGIGNIQIVSGLSAGDSVVLNPDISK